MNFPAISTHLTECGYNVSAIPGSDESVVLRVELRIGKYNVSLIHWPMSELTGLPAFFLDKASTFPRLAHTYVFRESDVASICINVPDAVSVNFERPELAFEESLKRHINLLTCALTDEEWNASELLREFEAGWHRIVGPDMFEFVCLSERGELEELSILKPRAGRSTGLQSYFFGYPEGYATDKSFSPINQLLNDREAAKGIGIVIPLSNLKLAPERVDELAEWYLAALSDLAEADRVHLTELYSKHRSHEFWVVFNAPTPSGRTWFGIRLTLKNTQKGGKKTLPLKDVHLRNWNLKAFTVSLFNKERLMPRSGANSSLGDKNILLIGCGSVGGEIADKLAASGIGRMTLSDPDTLTLDNLYRHILAPMHVSSYKSSALKFSLIYKYPWLSINGMTHRLLDLRNRDFLTRFDLIIIAIGSPTHERLFNEYLLKEKIKTPVINTWVEGYGVGGHAVLAIPGKKGCLLCSYMDPTDFSRGLASNLNFLKPNQNLTKNHAGCGDAFLPYSYISSTQTSLIAADLAVKYLLGTISDSSKVSWKGDPSDAMKSGFQLSDRFKSFTCSLEIIPLYKQGCDLCDE
ncbi:ThiF family adenylyltransferase [Citrobacter sp. TBCS-14]|uniref:ThiF family adenylyltransferase n=1 Tax=Citrobacter sp. TBCS-14 TaxID=2576409 RepID=UPI001136DF8F|nr:ThiF family adenylyltransferase [Citrobacter sp. TBCS-14]TKU68818.1 ThiF family adenylyltransferase [Citrobacter sp. TBCS-14]